jgi:HK97 family phage prohead protease
MPELTLRQHIRELDISEEAKALLSRAGLHVPAEIRGGLELRADGTDGPVQWAGYAVPWDQPALIRDWWDTYFEVFSRGSWLDTIAERGPDGDGQIKLCYKHDGAVLSFGSGPTAGKLTALFEDDYGVRYEAETIDTSTGRDLSAELLAGTVDRTSFAFEAKEETVTKDTEPWTYTVGRAHVYEISPVNWPAYSGSVIDQVRDEITKLPVADALRSALRAVRAGRELSPAALRALDDAASVAIEIKSSIEADARASAEASDAGETAGAVDIERCRFEMSRTGR